MFNRNQNSKFITNSFFLIYVFYILLAALTKGFRDLVLPSFIEQHILLIPIILGNLGLSWGLFNLAYEPLISWNYVKKAAYFIMLGTLFLFLSQLILILCSFLEDFRIAFLIMYSFGIAFFPISGILYSTGYIFFRKDLKTHYFKKYIAKFPNIYIILAYIVQSIGYVFLLIWGLSSNIIGLVFNILGIVTIAISLLGLGIGFYPLFISFRAYPKIMEKIEELLIKKDQTSSKKAKKAS